MEEKVIAASHSNGPELPDQVEEAKLSDTKCPFCKKYMIVTDDNEIEKVFHCDNCSGNWGYDKETRRMYRVRG